jgi:two-component system response regulator YesN
MYKVLIIDDEEPSRDAIRILGKWEQMNVGDIYEASNGKAGIAAIREHKPDIVLVDMKMPEMDGIEFLKIVESEFPDICCIVISGYNDFEYARQAIQSKAVDYLLKPVNKQELNQTLRKTVEKIEDKRKKENDFIDRNIALNMSLPKLKEKIFMSIIDKTFNKQMNEANLQLIHADDASKSFGLALLRIMNLEEIKEHRFKNETDLLYFAITNVINEMGNSDFQCFSFGNPRFEKQIIVIFTYEGLSNEEFKSLSYSFMNKVIRNLNELFAIKAVAGMGDMCQQAVALGDSYKSASQILDSINIMAMKNAAFSDVVVSKGITENHFITKRITLIRNAFENSNLPYLTGIVSDYIQNIKKSGYFSLGNATRALHEFVILLNDIALELGVPQQEILKGNENLKASGVTFDFTSMEQYEQILYRLLDVYFNKIKNSLNLFGSFNVHDIKEYIENYYFEEIKISMFTEKYFLSREYLMKLFKQEFGCGIYEYVQKVRMEKAKQLLGDPKLKIQNISEMLGYSDKNYFSKAFKNYYHLSPSDFRLNPFDE